jgi:hypothetical protein
MGLPINDLVSLLGKVIHVELTSESEDLYIGYFKVKGIKRDNEDRIVIAGADEEGFNREIPITWVADYYLVS